jgi:hypothetical protein
MAETRTIDCTPDGLLLAAFNAAGELEEQGFITFKNPTEQTEFSLGLFKILALQAPLIKKSSWVVEKTSSKQPFAAKEGGNHT